MAWMNLMGIPSQIIQGGTTGANPQINVFQNFGNIYNQANIAYSNGTLSIHAVNIPASISFNNIIVGISHSSNQARTNTIQFGLYSLNGGTVFSLANSASQSVTFTSANSWVSMVTSATQNITPGGWYFAFNVLSGGNSSLSLVGNGSFNPAGANPSGLLMGRMTVSTNAMPATIATSNLDITGQDALRQPLIILTA